MLGADMESGELPGDEALIGGMVRNICFENARQYLGLELDPSTTEGAAAGKQLAKCGEPA
ncbi:MAG: hypothetical protein WCC59_16770, partial [Terriglobales bacterium]